MLKLTSFGILIAGTVLAWLLAGCAPAAAPTPAPPSPVGRSQAQAGPDWQAEWEKVKADAQKEGSLVIHVAAGPAVREPISRIFREQYNVNLDWVYGRSSETVQKIVTEQRVGLYNADVLLTGASTVFALKAAGGEGVMQSLDPFLILPEVIDKKAWWGGNLIFHDQQHSWAAFLAYPSPTILINKTKVKPGEVKGWNDLLHPKWKGEILLYNPKDGAGLSWAYNTSEVVMSRDYMRQFARQEPLILPDSRQQVEWVARGKYPVSVAARTENMVEFVNLGAPVEIVSSIEGVHMTAGSGGVGVFKNAPRTAATKLFINWALSKEGGTVLSKLIGGQSSRLDVPTDFLDQTMVRQPGGKYFNTITAEHEVKKLEYIKVAAEIFGPLMK